MKKVFVLFFISCFILSCKYERNSQKETEKEDEKTDSSQQLNEKSAAFLYHFAFECIDKEYPNKLGQVLGDAKYICRKYFR